MLKIQYRSRQRWAGAWCIQRVLLLWLLIGDSSAEPVTITNSVNGKGIILGSGTYESGSEVTLRAVPEVDWRFDYWEGVSQTDAARNPLIIEVSSGLQPTAIFIEDTGRGRFRGGALELEGNSNGETSTWIAVPEDLTDVVSFDVSPEAWHIVALLSDGTVKSWGRNFSGQTDVPSGLTNVVAVSAGREHSVALRSDGTVIAWGGNTVGQTDMPTHLSDVVSISTGEYDTVALKSDGTVVAWGSNFYGQTNVPTDLLDVVAVTAGEVFMMALKSDGSVVKWGDFPDFEDWLKGALDVPIGLKDVVSVSAGGANAVALRSNGSITAWGANWSGQNEVPAGAMNVVAVLAGAAHTVALRPDGKVVAWGENGDTHAMIPVGWNGAVKVIPTANFNTVALRASQLSLVGDLKPIELIEVGNTLRLAPQVALASSYQWYRNGDAISGANSLWLATDSLEAFDSGSYQLLAQNDAEALLTPPTEVYVLSMGYPRVTIDGSEVFASSREGDEAEITLTTTFPDGQIFYTLDGSEPTLDSTKFAAPFTVVSDVVIRAMALNSDFTQQVTSDPVVIEIVPTYALSTDVSGNGDVYRLPFSDRYLQDEIVTLTATPDTGWRFVRWESDISGGDATTTVAMAGNRSVRAVFEAIPQHLIEVTTVGGGTVSGGGTYYEDSEVAITATPAAGWQFIRWDGSVLDGESAASNRVLVDQSKSVQAVFATTVGTTVVGAGTVRLDPDDALYSYGSRLKVIAQSDPGNYLALWGNAVNGSFNPHTFEVTTGSPVISALFSSLGSTQVPLDVSIVGGGTVSGDPSKMAFNVDENVMLTATAWPGFSFLEWSGDVTGRQNQSSVTLAMIEPRNVTATFVPGTPPDLATIATQTVDEETTFILALAATDADQLSDSLTYQLVEAPDGMTMDPDGTIKWTPTEAQGPASYPVMVRVIDATGLVAEQSFSVQVQEVNRPPVLAEVVDQSLLEGGALVVPLTWSDPDAPLQTLTLSLVGAPVGMVVGEDRVLWWTPGEADGPGVFPITLQLSDGVTVTERSFTVTVGEVNTSPRWLETTDQSIEERQTLSLQLAAVDDDLPTNILAFSLLDAPEGLTVSSAGKMEWTPTEAQGGQSYTVRAKVVDSGDPVLEAEESFAIEVVKVNHVPVIAPVVDQSVAEGSAVMVEVAAMDNDLPVQLLSFRLIDAPAGAAIDEETGELSWTPTEDQGPGGYTIVVEVSDTGSPELTATTPVTVSVTEVNVPPILDVIPDQSIDELTALNLSVTATDADLPANPLVFTLVDGPVGLIVESSGEVKWTPSESQGPSIHEVNVSVSDGVADVNQQFTIVVNEVNTAPQLVEVPDQAVVVGEEVIVRLTSVDSDLPSNSLTYSLVSGPAGAIVSGDTFRWTPSESLGSRVETVNVEVRDNGEPVAIDQRQFALTVPATPPLFSGISANIVRATDQGKPVATVDWSAPEAVDNVEVASLESTHPPGTEFPVGVTIVTYTAKDLAGNAASASFTVTVVDDEMPVIAGVPGNIVVSPDVGSSSASVSWGEPTASDNVGVVTLVSTHEPGTRFVEGSTTAVNYTARDAAGNEATASFTVTVENFQGAAGFRDWLAAMGDDPATGAYLDANHDGFANVFHYLLDVPLQQYVQHDRRGIAPLIDTGLLAKSAAFLFKVPDILPAGVKVVVEVTEDGKSWRTLASRSAGQQTWQFDLPVRLEAAPPVGGLETVAVGLGKTYQQSPVGLFRLRVVLDGE